MSDLFWLSQKQTVPLERYEQAVTVTKAKSFSKSPPPLRHMAVSSRYFPTCPR